MSKTLRSLANTLLAGALAALPLATTALIFVWAARLAVDYLGPGSVTGNILMSIGLTIGGSELLAYLVGALVVVVAIFLLGALVRSRMRTVLSWVFDSVMRRIPVVRSVYGTVSKFVGLLGQRDDESSMARSMSPVWLHFGGVGGAAVLGLLSTPEPVRIGEIDYLAVLVPTSPVPVGGGLLYVPRDWVQPANVGVEGLTSIYVSMGITSPQHLDGAGRSNGSR